jgi:hypothetical protein
MQASVGIHEQMNHSYTSSRETLHNLEASGSQELGEVGRAETSDGVPAGLGAEAVGVAAGVRAGRDVIQRGRGGRVQPRVEEAERRLAGGDEAVVDEADGRREDRRRAGGATDRAVLAARVDLHVLAECGDVGEATAGGVVLAGVGRAEAGDVRLDLGGLVRRRSEVVREAAAREAGRDLRVVLGGTDGGEAGGSEHVSTNIKSSCSGSTY